MSFYLAVELRQHSVAVNVLCPGPPGPRGPTRSPRRARRGLGIGAGEPPDGMVGRQLSRVRVLARSIRSRHHLGRRACRHQRLALFLAQCPSARGAKTSVRLSTDRSATPAVPLTRLCCAPRMPLPCPTQDSNLRTMLSLPATAKGDEDGGEVGSRRTADDGCRPGPPPARTHMASHRLFGLPSCAPRLGREIATASAQPATWV
jgi:hypothetical protein